MVSNVTASPVSTNPYVGPIPLQAGQPLFGREREVAELRYLLTSERIVLLYSPSGAGKTSIVQAGLIPALKDQFDIWGPTRLNTRPTGAGNRYVRSAINGFDKSDEHSDLTLRDYAAQRRGDLNPLMIFDQFEEILRVDQADIEAKKEFFRQLGEVLRDPQIWALIILREDYLAPFDPYAKLIPSHLHNRYRIDRLTRQNAMESVERPSNGTGRTFAPGVVKELVDNLATATGDYVEPLQLQVVCRDLWDRMNDKKGDRRIIESSDLGDVGNALKSYYDRAVLGQPARSVPVERAIREWFQNRLITPDGVRNQVRDKDTQTGALDSSLVAELLDTYLIRPEPRGATIWYEISHDRLVIPIQTSNAAWLQAHLNKLQKAAVLWGAQGRKKGLLLAGAELALALGESKGDELQENEKEFLEACQFEQAAARRERRQAMLIKCLAVIAALVAVVAGFEAFDAGRQKTKAVEEAAAAQKNFEKAQANEKRANDNLQTANENRMVAGWNLDRANASSLTAALNESKANQNLVRLFQQKAAESLVSAYAENSSDDFQSSWVYTTAALARATGPVPEAAGRLLNVEVQPGGKAAPPVAPVFIAKAALLPGAGGFWSADHKSEDERGWVISCKGTGCGNPGPRYQPNADAVVSVAVDSEGKRLALGRKGYLNLRWLKKSELTLGSNGGATEASADALTFSPPEGNRPLFLVAGTDRGDLALIDRLDTEPRILTTLQLVAPCEAKAASGSLVALATVAQIVDDKCVTKIRAIAVAPGHAFRVAVAGADGDVRFFDVPLFDVRRSRFTPAGGGLAPVIHTGQMGLTSMAFWPGTAFLITGHSDGTVNVWDTATGALVAGIRLHDDAVLAIAIDKSGEWMRSVSRDSVAKQVPLKPEILGRKWDLRNLLTKGGAALRTELYRVSREKLGFDASKDEPVRGPESRLLAARYFSTGSASHFTREEFDAHDPGILLARRRRAPNSPFPRVNGDEILLLPDQLEGARSAIVHRQELKTAFKAEFDYKIWNELNTAYNKIGDGFAFMFYKDTEPYRTGTTGSPGFSFVPGSGYGVAFNAYGYTSRGLRLFTPSYKTGDPVTSPALVYTGNKWEHACIEVSAEPMKPMCTSDTAPFHGIRAWLGSKLILNYADPLDVKSGGFGFGAASGEAVAGQWVRNVKITRAGASVPDAALAFTKNDSAFRIAKVDASAAEVRGLPAFVNGNLVLTLDEELYQASAVLLGEKLLPPGDFSVEFEYSMKKNHYSLRRPGNGIVFMFGKDPEPYLARPLPSGDSKGFLDDSGFGIHFAPNSPGIELRDRQGKMLAQAPANTMRVLPNVYSEGTWRRVRVDVIASTGRVRVVYEGTEVINQPLKLDGAPRAIGFGAATADLYESGASAEQSIRNVVIRTLDKPAKAPAPVVDKAQSEKENLREGRYGPPNTP